MKKRLELRKQTVALLDGEKAHIYGGAAITCGTPYCEVTVSCDRSIDCPVDPETYHCTEVMCSKVSDDCAPSLEPTECKVSAPCDFTVAVR